VFPQGYLYQGRKQSQQSAIERVVERRMGTVNNEKVLYREVQHFRQAWLWAFLIAILLMAVYSIVQQMAWGRPFGSNPAPNVILMVIVAIFGVAFPTFFYLMNLTTEVHGDGLYFRFFPFHRSFRVIPWRNLKECGVRNYSALRDYGGWGIRYGREGKAYNVSGNRGVQLRLTNGDMILIGSQRPEELFEAIDLAISHGSR